MNFNVEKEEVIKQVKKRNKAKDTGSYVKV